MQLPDQGNAAIPAKRCSLLSPYLSLLLRCTYGEAGVSSERRVILYIRNIVVSHSQADCEAGVREDLLYHAQALSWAARESAYASLGRVYRTQTVVHPVALLYRLCREICPLSESTGTLRQGGSRDLCELVVFMQSLNKFWSIPHDEYRGVHERHVKATWRVGCSNNG